MVCGGVPRHFGFCLLRHEEIVAVCFTFLQFMDFDSIFTSFDTPIAPVVSWKDVGKVS